MRANILNLLDGLAHQQIHLEEKSCLFHTDDPVEFLFCVEEGEIDLTRRQPDGQELVLFRAQAGSILAEASIYVARYHCDAVVRRPSCVLAVAKTAFRNRLETNRGFAEAWEQHLAQEVRKARTQVEILSLKTVAARLDSWLALNGGGLSEKGEWKLIARQLGVSPEALYRELSRRRAVGQPIR